MNSDYKAGFEACRAAAVEVCQKLEQAINHAALIKGNKNPAALSALAMSEGACASAAIAIAALTPEETDNG